MQPQVDNIHNDGERLYFTMKDVEVCVPNAIRRTILSHIDTLVFRGFPHEENNIDIIKNSTKFNNEYLKQRISCIPIFNDNDVNFENFLQTYQIIIQEENNSQEQLHITTDSAFLKIKDIRTQEFKPPEFVKKYFPPDPISGEYILICILYPNYNPSNEENEKLHIVAKLDKGTAHENACWNVVHHCAYENVRDEVKIQDIASKIEDPLKKNDFLLLDAQRVCIQNEYKMSLESLGIFTNEAIVHKACEYILQCFRKMFSNMRNQQQHPETIVSYDKNATHMTSNHGSLHQKMQGSLDHYFSLHKEDDFFVFKLQQDDYTIGKMVETYFFELYEKEISFVGFKKKHPTEPEAFIYIKFKNKHSENDVIVKMTMLIEKLIQMINTIQTYFPIT